MIKIGQSFLIKCLSKIFNSVLSSGNYPRIWAKGFIIPLFKSGSKEDPTNYRGITIGSCLGKVFTKIFNSRLEIFCFNQLFSVLADI